MNKNKGDRLISAIGIALIILPLLSPILLILILLNPVINEDANFIPPEAAPLLPLRPESHNPALVGRQIGAFDEVDAIRNGWHDRVQAIADGARFVVLENLHHRGKEAAQRAQRYVFASVRNAPYSLSQMADIEVDEQSSFYARCFEIGDQLGYVDRQQLFHRL